MQAAGTIEVKYAGVPYSASYSVKDGWVHLLTPLGSARPKRAGDSPEGEETARQRANRDAQFENLRR